jgi:hypothetical protein
MIPQFVLSALSRKQITDFLALPYKTKETKSQLVRQLYLRITSDALAYANLLNAFPYELAVGPTEAQMLLHCSSAERRRWIHEGKLPVLYYRTLSYPCVTYPVHERQVMMKITQDDIVLWRIEHRCQVRQQRSEAIIRSREQKKFLLHMAQMGGQYKMKIHLSRRLRVCSTHFKHYYQL